MKPDIVIELATDGLSKGLRLIPAEPRAAAALELAATIVEAVGYGAAEAAAAAEDGEVEPVEISQVVDEVVDRVDHLIPGLSLLPEAERDDTRTGLLLAVQAPVDAVRARLSGESFRPLTGEQEAIVGRAFNTLLMLLSETPVDAADEFEPRKPGARRRGRRWKALRRLDERRVASAAVRALRGGLTAPDLIARLPSGIPWAAPPPQPQE